MIKISVILLLLIGNFLLNADNFNWGWDEPNISFNGIYEQQISKKKEKKIFLELLNHYRNFESPWRGTHCPCFPSCSTFTLYSIKNYGFINGFIMGLDRIFFRENYGLMNEINYYSIERTSFIDQDLKSGIYDPPEANNIFQKKDWRSVNPYFYFIYERNSSSTN